MKYSEYPHTPRVRRDLDGIYRWKAKFNVEQRRNVVKITLGVCGGMCAVFVVMAVLMGGDAMWVTLLSCAAVMVIAGVISWIYFRASENMYQPYEMAEDYVRYVGGRRNDTYFRFESVRRVTVRREQDLIVMKNAIVSAPIFIPHEDFEYVLSYILRRLTPDAEVIYE